MIGVGCEILHQEAEFVRLQGWSSSGIGATVAQTCFLSLRLFSLPLRSGERILGLQIQDLRTKHNNGPWRQPQKVCASRPQANTCCSVFRVEAKTAGLMVPSRLTSRTLSSVRTWSRRISPRFP